MTDFAQVEPFAIDDGELDNLTPTAAFVLGVEWEMTRHQMDQPVLIKTVHTDNQRRIDVLLARNGYHRKWYLGDDWCDVIAALDEKDLEESEDDGA